jgi:hypothetical protein
LTGNYSFSETYTAAHGGPSISDNLSNPFSKTLTLGTLTSPASFFTLSPASGCSGGGCSSNIETDTVTVSFTNLKVLGISVPTLQATGIFSARYSGSELACAVGDGKSPASGETDCFIWQGAANSWNGSTTLGYDLGNGDMLDIIVYNATDWNITPKIAFELVDAPARAPEPASLALIASALAGFEFIRRRRGKVS